MKQEKLPFVLIFGSTGKSGYHIASRFIEEGYPVRVVVRSKAKLQNLFREREIAFESIIQGPLKSDETLEQAFSHSRFYGPPEIVVSSLGKNSFSGSTKEIEYDSQVKIIDMCKKYKVKKYIFVTAALMERPWHPITIMIDLMVPRVYHWKAKAENYLRTSGIDYIIVRPTGLVGDQNDDVVTNYEVGQGDKLSGQINRHTLAKLICEVSKAEVPAKVTFECTKCKKDIDQNIFRGLKADTAESIVNKPHLAVGYACRGILLGLFLLAGYKLFLQVSE